MSRISARSIETSHRAELVVAGAVGDRLEGQLRADQGQARGWGRVALACQQVEHHVAVEQVGAQRFGAGCVHGVEAVRQHRAEDAYELAVAVGVRGQAPAHLGQRRWQLPIPKWRTVAQRAPPVAPPPAASQTDRESDGLRASTGT